MKPPTNRQVVASGFVFSTLIGSALAAMIVREDGFRGYFAAALAMLTLNAVFYCGMFAYIRRGEAAR